VILEDIEMEEWESDTRKLTKLLALHAEILSKRLGNEPHLQESYDAICDVLDYLNWELEQEPINPYSGPILDTWKSFKTN